MIKTCKCGQLMSIIVPYFRYDCPSCGRIMFRTSYTEPVEEMWYVPEKPDQPKPSTGTDLVVEKLLEFADCREEMSTRQVADDIRAIVAGEHKQDLEIADNLKDFWLHLGNEGLFL